MSEKYRMRCIGSVVWGGEKGFPVMTGQVPSCGWSGVRSAYAIECECYDLYALYCRPLTPGPGCPSGIDWPCPRCKGAVTGRPVVRRIRSAA